MAKKRHPAAAARDEATYKAGTVAPSPHQAPQTRRRAAAAAAGTRPWLVVSESGESHLEEVGKHAIMRRTGLPGRDLRILDPMLSYPSTVLGRERAIVVNLEHIKAIITATEALVLNPRDRTVVEFVDELQRRVSSLYPAGATSQQAADADLNVTGAMDKGMWASTSNTPSPPSDRGKSQSPIRNEDEDGLQHVSEMSKALGPKSLPFEFRVLEVCLESACRCLETETVALEKEAYPALDELTSKISTLNLERVRQIKSRLVAISGRVQKVRDELEHLLDDDMDMAEMYLTDKLLDGLEETVSKGENGADDFESDDERYEDNRSRFRSMSDGVGDYKPNIQELEMLLEAYFVQIEGTLNKLSTMREYVDDTEDYINIMLDDKQNQLLQMGVMLSTATLILSAGIVVVGVFGMNIHIALFNPDVNPMKFWETIAGIVAGGLGLYFIAVVWGKRRGLLA